LRPKTHKADCVGFDQSAQTLLEGLVGEHIVIELLVGFAVGTAFADGFGGDARDEGVRRDVLGDDRAGGDDGSPADMHAGQESAIGIDLGIRADLHGGVRT